MNYTFVYHRKQLSKIKFVISFVAETSVQFFRHFSVKCTINSFLIIAQNVAEEINSIFEHFKQWLWLFFFVKSLLFFLNAFFEQNSMFTAK